MPLISVITGSDSDCAFVNSTPLELSVSPLPHCEMQDASVVGVWYTRFLPQFVVSIGILDDAQLARRYEHEVLVVPRRIFRELAVVLNAGHAADDLEGREAVRTHELVQVRQQQRCGRLVATEYR